MILYLAAGYSFVSVCTFMALRIVYQLKPKNKEQVFLDLFLDLFFAVFWPPFWLTYVMLRYMIGDMGGVG